MEKRLLRRLGQANKRFQLIEPGDCIGVGLSGGKDSWALLELLLAYRRARPFSFEIVALYVDAGWGASLEPQLRASVEGLGVQLLVGHQEIAAVAREISNPCSLCARMRRGLLQRIALEEGLNKIALGHHREDLIETLLINLFQSGRIRSMAARVTAEVEIIRPMALCSGEEIVRYVETLEHPILRSGCPMERVGKRAEVRALLRSLERENPEIRGRLLAALGNLEPEHLLDPRYLSRSVQL